MKRRPRLTLIGIALLICLDLVIACREEPTSFPPSPTGPMATAAAIRSPAPSLSPAPSTTPPPPSATPVLSPTPNPSSTPSRTPAKPTTLASGLSVVDLGVPEGDCFEVRDLVADPETGRIYVLCAHSDWRSTDALVVLDGVNGQRLSTVHLGGERTDSGGQLAFDPQTGRLYVVSSGLGKLVVLDTETLNEVGRLSDVWQVVVAPGADRFYARTSEALTAYRAADLTPLVSLSIKELSPTSSKLLLAYNPVADHLYVAPKILGAAHTPIQVRRGGDLTLETEVVVTGTLFALAAGGQANRLYVATDNLLLAMDGETLAQTEQALDPIAQEGIVSRLLVDEATGQVHLLGYHTPEDFWLVADGASLETLYKYQAVPDWAATVLDPAGRLLAARWGGDVVLRYDPATGQPLEGPANRFVLGRRLLTAAVHPETDQLYVVDSAGSLLILDGPSLQPLDIRPYILDSGLVGMTSPTDAGLALDAERGRLFVADVEAGQTRVLDLETLESVGTLDVAGVMAVDAEGGRLFVADEHVYLYDTETLESLAASPGQPVISFESSDPTGRSWAQDVVYDGAGGRLFVRIYARVSGPASRNMSSYGVYDANTLERLTSLHLGHGGTYVRTPVVLPESGRILVAYHGGGGCPMDTGPVHYDCRQGLVFFADDDYVQMDQIQGLTGHLMADTGQGPNVYLLRERDLLALDPQQGYPIGGLTLEANVWDAALDPATDRFYLWGWDHLATLPAKELVAGASSTLPYQYEDFIYPSPNVEADRTLFAAIPATGIYRSEDDGVTWQLASWGLPSYYFKQLAFSPDYEADGTLFVKVSDGTAYASVDKGETWLLASAPLPVALVATPTPRPQTSPTPSGTAPSLTPLAIPGPGPVVAGTPIPSPLPVISPDNALSVVEVAHYGGGEVNQLTYAPDGSLVAAASRDAVYLYDGQTLAPVGVLLQDAQVYSVAFSPDGKLLAAGEGGRDEGGFYRVWLWEVSECGNPSAEHPGSEGCGRFLGFLEGHSWVVETLAFSPDGRTLASGSWDKSVRLWGVSECVKVPAEHAPGEGCGTPLHTLEGHNDWIFSLAFSPDGGTLASGDGRGDVRLWQVSECASNPQSGGCGTPLHTLKGHRFRVLSLAFSPDGQTLASGGAYGVVQLWGVSEGSQMHTLETEDENPVLALAFAADGETLISGSETNAIRFWRVSDGELQRTADTEAHNAQSLIFAPDLQTWVTASTNSYALALWRLDQGDKEYALEGYTGAVYGLAFSPDGKTLAYGSGTLVWLRRVEDGRLLNVLIGHHGSIYGGVAFSPDGKMLASGSHDQTVRLWRAGECASPPAAGCGELLFTLEGHTSTVQSVAFSPDGETLASGSNDGTVRLWGVGECANMPAECPQGEGCSVPEGCGKLLRTLEGHEKGVYSVAISPDGETLASGAGDGTVILWRVEDGSQIRTLLGHIGFVADLAFSPDGKTLASAASTLRLWRVSDGSLLHILTGHEDQVDRVAFSPDGTLLASGSDDMTVRLWRVEDGSLLHTLEGYAGDVKGLAFSPDGALLASGGLDYTLRLWGVVE